MNHPGKGNRNRPRKGRQGSSGASSGEGGPGEPEAARGNPRQWRRNLRRREPSTPENSWLATQPEFQRYWGDPDDPNSAGQTDIPQDEPQPDPYAAPQDVAPPRPRRKPADLSTLMARYTARAEEQESRAPPPPPPPPGRRGQPVAPAAPGRPGQPRARIPAPPPPAPAQEQVRRPAPARNINTDPKFVASPLPAEPPEVEPGRPAPAAPADRPAPVKTGGRVRSADPAPGSIIVSDGQVKVVEAGSQGPEDQVEHTPPPPADPTPPPDIAAPQAAPATEPALAEPGPDQGEIVSQYLPSEDPDYASVSIRPASAPPPQPQYPPQPPQAPRIEAESIEAEPIEAGPIGDEVEWRDGDIGADRPAAPEPRPAAPAFEPEAPEEWWPPEPPLAAPREPVRFDGPLPYQRQMHEPQGANLADWDAANERLDFEPAWHAGQGGGGGFRFFLLFVVLAVVGAGGYGIWSGDARRVVEFTSAFMTDIAASPNAAPNASQKPDEALAVAQAPVADPASETPLPTPAVAPPASPSPLAPVVAPVVSPPPGPQIAANPNPLVRQSAGPTPQTTTLWWRPKAVTQFADLTPAELAGQPEPPTARGESVMAPSGPLPGVSGGPQQINSQVNGAEIARIDDLIQSFAIQDADALIAPLLASAPQDPSVLMLSGRTALARSANLDALAIFDKVLAAVPGNVDARVGRGVALVNLGRATEARAIADEVLAASPGHLGAMWLSVEALAATGGLEQAIGVCGRLEAAGAVPGSGEWCRGVASKRARRPLEAETIFINALQSGSRDFVSMRQLYFRFKGYFNGAIDGFASDELINAATRCAAVRDCNTAGL